MTDTMINRGVSAVATTAVMAGVGYAVKASYLPKVALNFLGRAAFQIPHYAAVGLLSAGAYEAFNKVLNSFKTFQDGTEKNEETGKDEVKTNYIRTAASITGTVALAAAAGYGVVAAGLVVGVASQVALVSAALAGVAVLVHLAAKAIFSACTGKEEPIIDPKKEEVTKEKLQEQKTAQEKVAASLDKKLALINAKAEQEKAYAAAAEANKKFGEAEAVQVDLGKKFRALQDAVKGKVEADLQKAVTDLKPDFDAINFAKLDEAVKAAKTDDEKKAANEAMEAANKTKGIYDAAVKNLTDFKAATAGIVPAENAYKAATTQCEDLQKAADAAEVAHKEAEKTLSDLEAKRSAEKKGALNEKLVAAKDSLKAIVEQLDKLEPKKA